MIAAGLDIGSVATKAVVLRDERPAGMSLVRTGAEPAAAAEQALADAAARAGIGRRRIQRLVATGYGRRTAAFADATVTEITACARGALLAGAPWGTPRLLVDLGGQDTKVILLDEHGLVQDFVMNDKCAAGTGRFLEVMAGVLGVPVDQLGATGTDNFPSPREKSNRSPLRINATCTVFAESEVISLIARGERKENIIAGLHAAIALRIAQMAAAMGEHDVFFAGGGALNAGVVGALRRALGRRVHVPPAPQHVVAAGAALTAARG